MCLHIVIKAGEKCLELWRQWRLQLKFPVRDRMLEFELRCVQEVSSQAQPFGLVALARRP
jgi:hypothetical protein